MNSMNSILLHILFVKFTLANLNLNDDFVPFFSFFHFFPKWKGRKYFFRNGRNPVITVVITVHGRNMPTLSSEIHRSHPDPTRDSLKGYVP